MRAPLNMLRRQDGIALPTVMAVLVTTSLIATSAMAVSMQGSRDSAHDRDSKAAMAAAQAAGDYAYLRTTELQPAADRCVTDAAVLPQADGECPEYTVPASSGLGNGATMRYVVTRPGPTYCPGARPLPDGANDRCITATGVVAGIQKRTRMVVNIRPVHKPWASVGVKAKDRVEIKNSGAWITNVGTNGRWISGNGADITGQIQLGPGGSEEWGNNSEPTEPTISVPAWEFPDVDYEPSRLTNDNGLLSSTVYTDNASFPRRFYMGNNVDFDFPSVPGGVATYNFCLFQMTNGNNIRIPAGQTVRIFIDSPARPGSGCSGTGAGRMDIDNSPVLNETLTNGSEGKNPAQLEFYVYGTATGGSEASPDVDFKNSAKFWGTIYAPNSYMHFKNSAELGGGVVGREIEFKNSAGFTWDTRIRDRGLPGQEGSTRQTWSECNPSRANAADPESGCS